MQQGVDLDDYRAVGEFRNYFGSYSMDYAYEVLSQEDFESVRQDIPDLAYWYIRFFKPGQEEEWYARVLPNGETYAIGRDLPEEAPGASPTEDEARELAIAHIQSRYQLSPRDWKEIDVAINERDERIDYGFVWERRAIGEGGSLRSTIDVVDGQALGFDVYVHAPESWRRDRSETSTKEFLGQITLIIVMLMFLVLLGTHSIVAFVNHETEWRRWIGLAAIVAVIIIISSLNRWDEIWIGYQTSTPTDIHQGRHAVNLLQNAVQAFATMWLSVVFVHAIAKRKLKMKADWGRTLSVGGSLGYIFILTIMVVGSLDYGDILEYALDSHTQAPTPRILGHHEGFIPLIDRTTGVLVSAIAVAIGYVAFICVMGSYIHRPVRLAFVAAIAAAAFAAQADHEWRVIVICGLAAFLGTPITITFARWLQRRILGASFANHLTFPVMTIALLLGVVLIGEVDVLSKTVGWFIVSCHLVCTLASAFLSRQLDAA